MPWKIKNTVLDPSRAMRHRRATRLSTEPLICGRVLRIRSEMTISDKQYEAGKTHIEACIEQGVVSAEQVDASGAATKRKEAKPAENKAEDHAASLPDSGEMDSQLEQAAEKAEPAEDEAAPAEEGETDPEAQQAADHAGPEEPVVEAGGAGWYVIRLEGEEVGKVRGKAALREWFTENGYDVPSEYEEQE